MSKVNVSVGGAPPPKKTEKPSPAIIVGGVIASLIALLLILAAIIPDTPTPEAEIEPTLPPHTATKTPLGRASRVEVNSTDPNLTRDDCVALSTHYSPYAAGGGGQVVIQKPNPNPPWNGMLIPFCVDNMGSEGVVFSDSFSS